ncbi:hypothetical protein OCHUTO_0887 [Orientia chuto str. Dubai]|uniref:Uncharacterized protein n=2 Tax=Candidatus Orientia mediorientalis TaxID=911112 RepID=A0A0F3MHT7_9RICK|nr:hypothetical protein OCHUTO_0887 [Orientia chuto str. Dubai]
MYFGDQSPPIIQTLEQKQILVPKTHYVCANLPECASIVELVSYGSNKGLKIDVKLGTQTHHLSLSNFQKKRYLIFVE